MKIAFFDSGVGGLSVMREAFELFPHEQYLYYADSLNVPYGAFTREQVQVLILKAVDLLASQGIDALVLACHTASKLMGHKLKRLYGFPVISMQSGLNEMDLSTASKTLVCGTDLSIHMWKEELQNSLSSFDYVSLQQLSLFAEAAKFHGNEIRDYLVSKLKPFQWEHFDTIVLGCTHFVFFKEQIQALVPSHIRILDGISPTLNILNTIVTPNTKIYEKKFFYFVSGVPNDPNLLSPYLDLQKLGSKNKLNYSNM